MLLLGVERFACDRGIDQLGEIRVGVLCRPPGHHAGSDYLGGYSYLNNVAFAAEAALAVGRNRVAILDVDYHHGNGTQDIFCQRGDVVYASIHADPISFFGLDTRDYAPMARSIAALGLPTLIVMEGGYAVEALSANVAEFLSGF